MDLTTLIYGALIGLGLIATDVAIYAGSVVVEVTTAQNTETIGVDRATVESEIDGVLAHISATQSLVHPQPDSVTVLTLGGSAAPALYRVFG